MIDESVLENFNETAWTNWTSRLLGWNWKRRYICFLSCCWFYVVRLIDSSNLQLGYTYMYWENHSTSKHKYPSPAASLLPQHDPNKRDGPAKSITWSLESCLLHHMNMHLIHRLNISSWTWKPQETKTKNHHQRANTICATTSSKFLNYKRTCFPLQKWFILPCSERPPPWLRFD